MDTLTSLRVFCAVAELESFTAAASRLGLSPAMTSKHVQHLEDRLGIRLLNRTSRRVSLTEAGALYLVQARQALDGLDEVEAALSHVAVAPRGTLKVSAPVWIATTRIVAMLADYHRRYPEVRLDLDLSGRLVNLVDEGFDLALRATTPERLDPGLIARPLGRIDFWLVAAPSYIEGAGRIARIADLNDHSLLLYSGVSIGPDLVFNGAEGAETVRFRVVMRSGNETLLHLAALEGMGFAILPVWMVLADIAQGRLQAILPGVATVSTTLYAVYPSRKYLSAKVRTFIDHLASQDSPCTWYRIPEMAIPPDAVGKGSAPAR
ncbi:LysR family transcriptional regulator [Burkholderia seminalis]|uniref:LysR family transcriptional regulator n=1 Tax=Burkholderia seminalis TaxID=488731 RepID=UPI00158A482B|nr:LysR family transcriptional regulator [Burkholderia seminalis]MBJ9968796.1 LysR family transcriptional regulator [Burkholderia seminalis]MCA7953514.1 LysR family transcriptional regulator [Burkholderia seminalis]MDN7591446.1 LysR family transcriptional regulator [Burkholderia seminalis]